MATKYNLFVEGTAVTEATRAKKEAVIKIGEATGKAFEVHTDSGSVVHVHAPKPVAVKPAKAAAPKPAKAPAKPAVDEDDEETEAPMTKSVAYGWFKRSREGLRDAERGIERGDIKHADIVEALNDAMGSIGELLAALDDLGHGINGVL